MWLSLLKQNCRLRLHFFLSSLSLLLLLFLYHCHLYSLFHQPSLPSAAEKLFPFAPRSSPISALYNLSISFSSFSLDPLFHQAKDMKRKVWSHQTVLKKSMQSNNMLWLRWILPEPPAALKDHSTVCETVINRAVQNPPASKSPLRERTK